MALTKAAIEAYEKMRVYPKIDWGEYQKPPFRLWRGLSVVYGLYSTQDGMIRYVGKANNPQKRYFGHLSAARHGGGYPVLEWIRHTMESGFSIQMIVLDIAQRDVAHKVERHWIVKLLQEDFPLLNVQ